MHVDSRDIACLKRGETAAIMDNYHLLLSEVQGVLLEEKQKAIGESSWKVEAP
jgi:hypothetical protein